LLMTVAFCISTAVERCFSSMDISLFRSLELVFAEGCFSADVSWSSFATSIVAGLVGLSFAKALSYLVRAPLLAC